MKMNNKCGLLKYRYGILLVIIIFSFLRFINLDADPGLFTRAGIIGDEGYWGAEARNLALYGQLVIDEFTQGAATAPLYTFFSFLFFKVFGVSLYTARLTGATFGVLTIMLVYFFLKKYSEDIALWSSVFLAVNFNYFTYNRIGLVETLVSFFLVLTFYFFENKNFWFGAGLSYGLAVCAKVTTIWFFPAIILYLVFKIVRNEVSIPKVLRFVFGGAIIAVGLVLYQHHFKSVFQSTLDRLSANVLSGGMPQLRLLLGMPLNLTIFFTNKYYFINPLNVFLMICLVVYLGKVKSLTLLSKRAGEYIKILHPLDIIIISWVIGYSTSLILFSDVADRRMQLLAVILSIVPGVMLFRKNRPEYPLEELNIFQNIIRFTPFVVAGAVLGQYVLLPYLSDIALSYLHSPYRAQIGVLFVAEFISFVIVIIVSKRYQDWSKTFRSALSLLSFVVFIVLITIPFGEYLAALFLVSNLSRIIIILVSLLLFVIFGYHILRNNNAIHLMLLISSALIIFELANPTFASKEVSKHFNTITTNQDYVTGPLAHEVSFEAQYHPLVWHSKSTVQKDLRNINRNFVMRVKPKFFIYCDSCGRGPGDPFPAKDELKDIGAIGLEKIYSYGLYPVFGKDRLKFSLYKVSYAKAE